MFKKFIDYMSENKYYKELPIAVVLFIYAMVTDSLIELIIYMLYFIIFLEIIRSVIEFTKGHRIKIRVLIDAFIILSLREFIVNVAKLSKEDYVGFDALFESTTNMHILVYSGVIIFLFFARYLAVKTSPEKYDLVGVESQKERLSMTKDMMEELLKNKNSNKEESKNE
jgi:uncharacterized membrane protein (DUF373 family)